MASQTREPVGLDSSQQPRDDSVFSQLDVADIFIDIGDQPTPSQNLSTGMALGLLERACSVLGSPGLLKRSGSTRSTGAVAGTPAADRDIPTTPGAGVETTRRFGYRKTPSFELIEDSVRLAPGSASGEQPPTVPTTQGDGSPEPCGVALHEPLSPSQVGSVAPLSLTEKATVFSKAKRMHAQNVRLGASSSDFASWKVDDFSTERGMTVQGIVNIQGGFRFVGRVRLDHYEMVAGDPGAMRLARISPERLACAKAQLEKRAMDRSRSPRGAGAAGSSSAPTAPSQA